MAALRAHPQVVGVVGAGVAGLSIAWALQRRGIEVKVFDQTGVAAGASWGNAGWVTPSMATPLPSPDVLRYGLRALLQPSSPVFVPPHLRWRTTRFLTTFARNCTSRKWKMAMHALVPINLAALEIYEELAEDGVDLTTAAGSYLAGFRTEQERQLLVNDLDQARELGQELNLEMLDGTQAQEREPTLSEAIRFAIEVSGEKFIDPGELTRSLANRVAQQGGQVVVGAHAVRVETSPSPSVVLATGHHHRFDSVVIATGAWLEDLARPLGVRVPVQGGRGYSFSVIGDQIPTRAIYLPEQRVVCTPFQSGVRISGMMEIQGPDAEPNQRRIRSIITAAQSMLRGLDFDNRKNEWVGARPCTADGLPLIGQVEPHNVFVHGGHSMWGVTQSPATAVLLADEIATGNRSRLLAPFDPLR